VVIDRVAAMQAEQGEPDAESDGDDDTDES